MDQLSIGEMGRLARIQPSAIRYYERIGVLAVPRRVNGRRRYTAETLRRLVFVRKAREVGCSLDEIRALFAGVDDGAPASDEWRELAGTRIRAIGAQIARAEAVREVLRESLRCDCITLDGCELIESVCV